MMTSRENDLFSGSGGRVFRKVSNMALLSVLLMLLLAVSSALSARIAGFCAFGGSQYINTRHTLEELANRGHEVHNSRVC